ncbi:MAG TPA: RNA polymerase sigma factor [Vicinamibacterales bacterium]
MADAPDVERLYLACQPQVVRYLTRLVGPDTAHDLAQETFLRAARASAPDSDPGQKAWVFRIARNLALNHLRDTSRRTARAQDAIHTGAGGAGQETTLLVREALAQLAPLDREVFMLRESAGLNYAEIADACGMTGDAVRARLQRARQALRVLLAGTLAAERNRGVRLPGRTHE